MVGLACAWSFAVSRAFLWTDLYKKKGERLFTRFFKATNINSWHSVRSEKEGISRMLISERLKLDVTVKPNDTHDI